MENATSEDAMHDYSMEVSGAICGKSAKRQQRRRRSSSVFNVSTIKIFQLSSISPKNISIECNI